MSTGHPRRANKSSSQRPLRPRNTDLFGEVPVSHHDVYAWMLTVADIDPESHRSAGYARTYDVISKIIRAKLDGSFDEIQDRSLNDPRYRELIDSAPFPASETNVIGLREPNAPENLQPKTLCNTIRHRSKEIIKRERERLRRQKALRKGIGSSMLCRLPGSTPDLEIMLEDIGSPTAGHLAYVFQVHADTARRWIRENEAPQSVMLSLFWLTKWGMSAAYCNAHNDAVMLATVARTQKEQVTSLQKQVAQIERLADFGSANDPLPNVTSNVIKTHPKLTQIASVGVVAQIADASSRKDFSPEVRRSATR